MGEVYRAHDSRVGRDVAIKVLPHRLSKDLESRVRFDREARIVAAMSHPNIVALYEFDAEGETPYVVMELLAGETLRSCMMRGPVSWRRAAEIGASIAEGLAAAHAKGIIHRDLKPENVFLTTDGRVKILDFGLAKSRPRPAAAASATVPTERLGSDEFEDDAQVVGTVGYMAPEQLTGNPVTPAADLFALGCILFEIVIGHAPFVANSPIETMSSVLRDEMPEMTASGRRVPFELERIIRRCVEKHPDARFQSAGDLAFALRALTSGPAPRERAPSRWRKPTWIALAAVVVVAAIILAVRYWPFASETPAIRSLAVMPFVNASSDRANEYLSDGITESLIDTLSRIPDLAVVSRTSVFRYKGKDAQPQTIAKDLKVEALLTGRVIQPGTDLIVSTELIDGRTNRHLWGEQYRTKMSDLATLQATISREIAEQLKLQLSGATQRSVAKHYTEDGEAYRIYLEGRYELNKRTGEAFDRAIRYFRQAITKDPSYALAWAGLADAYILKSIYGQSPPVKALPLAREAAEHALSIDDSLAEAHTSLAYFKMNYEADLGDAAREFERAIALNPNYATARQWYARCLVEMHRYDDAVREIRRAEALDPLSLVIVAETGGVYADSGRLDEAVTECRRAIDLEPNFAFGHYVLAGAYLKQKKFDRAIAEASLAWRLGQDPRSLVRLGVAYASAGRTAEAIATLAQLEALSKQRFVPSSGLATLMRAVGRDADARAAMARAAEEMPPGQYARMAL
jgi:serine/threonine protein kinase/tetratricopeptide (TPR) repeat protein